MIGTEIMNAKLAVKMAVDCINKEIQRLAFDANLYEKLGAAHGEKASLKRKKLLEAAALLKEMVTSAESKIEAEE